MSTSAFHYHFELLACDYVQLNKSWKYNNVTSTFYRLYYIDKGAGELYTGEFSIQLKPGYIYLVPSFTSCNYRCHDYLSQYFICFAEGSADGLSLFAANRRLFEIEATADDIALVKKIVALNPNRKLEVSHNPRVYEKNKILTDYSHKNNLTTKASYVATCGLLLQLISRFMAAPEFINQQVKPINALIADALYYIQTNLRAEITVALLAKRANRSPDYFSRLFVDSTGELPLTYVQIKRVERARMLLKTTNLAFYEIAIETGFDSLSYFTRVFKKVTGYTPGRYIKEVLR